MEITLRIKGPISEVSRLDLLERATAPATPSSGAVSIYAKSDSKIYVKNDAGVESLIGSGGIEQITQAGHGFEIGQPVYFNGTNYVLAQADVDTTSEVIGLINSVIDVNNFEINTGGRVNTVAAARFEAGLPANGRSLA